jgi:PGF-pre-PGF domain-containing protein
MRNIEITNFCNGIYLRYDDETGDMVERITIENCEIHHNGADTGDDNGVHGIKGIGVFDSEIKSNKIHDTKGKGDSCESGGNGIFLMGISGYGAWNNLITENEIYNNAKGGFFTKMMCRDTTVSHNDIYGNGQGGIILRCKKSASHAIEHNNVHDNYGSGIWVGGPDNIVRKNTVTGNRDGGPFSGIGGGDTEFGGVKGTVGGHGWGIKICREAHNTEVTENTVCENDYVDIEVCEGITGTAGSENTCDTTENFNDDGSAGCMYRCSSAEDGGGGGDIDNEGTTSTEDPDNIEESYTMTIPVVGGFVEQEIDPDDRFDLPVTMISFESLSADVDVAVRIESLHDTSTDVGTPAPDLVYQNFNLDVPIPDDEIEDATIRFRVENWWMEENGVDSMNISLHRWDDDDSEWERTPTNPTSYDETYASYESSTQGFSHYAIVGKPPTREEVEAAAAPTPAATTSSEPHSQSLDPAPVPATTMTTTAASGTAPQPQAQAYIGVAQASENDDPEAMGVDAMTARHFIAAYSLIGLLAFAYALSTFR